MRRLASIETTMKLRALAPGAALLVAGIPSHSGSAEAASWGWHGGGWGGWRGGGWGWGGLGVGLAAGAIVGTGHVQSVEGASCTGSAAGLARASMPPYLGPDD